MNGNWLCQGETQEQEAQEREMQEQEAQEKEMQEQEAQEKEMQEQEAQEKEMQEQEVQEKEMQEQEARGQEKIWQKASELKPDPYKKQASLTHMQGFIEAKKIHSTPSISELIQIQLQYIPPMFWLLQGGLLLLLLLILFRLSGRGETLADYLWWSSIAAAWMGVLSHGMLGKHFSHGMAELEQSCYINLSQMWTIRVILMTGVDIVVLTIFSGGIALRTDMFFGRVTVYLLVPFVLSNVCCLLMVSALRGGRGRYTLAALAIVTAFLAAAPSVFPKAYTAAYLWVWFCLLFLGAAIFAGQVRSCYDKMIRGEMICWN